MLEGLKLVSDIFERAKRENLVFLDSCPGILLAVLVLSDPQNEDLLNRLITYCEEPVEKPEFCPACSGSGGFNRFEEQQVGLTETRTIHVWIPCSLCSGSGDEAHISLKEKANDS